MLAKLKDTELYYEVSGNGAPLLLIHGNGEDHTIFDAVMPELSEHFTVYAVDSRGHGKSAPCAHFDYGEMAEDFAQLIDVLSLEKPMLYGFSDGGIIGILLASRHPEFLSKMVISGANITPDGLTDDWINEFERMYRESGDDKLKMVLEQPNIPVSDLEKITIPVLVTAGSDDMIREEHTRMIAAHISDSKLVIYEGEDHLSYVVHSAKMLPALLEFLK